MSSELITTGLSSTAGVSGPLPTAVLSGTGAGWRLASVSAAVTTSATTGNRKFNFIVVDGAGDTFASGGIVPTVAASLTRYLDAYPSGRSSASFNGTHAICPLATIVPPDGYVQLVDSAAISANTATGLATSSSATTLTDSSASFTVNAWTGYTLLMGTDVTAIVTSNTSTVLTASGGWSDLVAGTAEASDATTMTDNDASWTTDTWIGYTVEMGGSTATVQSNTATVLTVDAWSPAAPATGAYKIYGTYSLYGDTVSLSATYRAMTAVER